MNVLVVGQGGREHAIAKTLLQDQQVTTVYCCPGNCGMTEAGIEVVAIDAMDFERLSAFAQQHQVEFTIVGPEQPLSAGIVDHFKAKGQLIFGPSQQATQLESSKSFAKAIMKELAILTAPYQICTNVEQGKAYLKTQTFPIVLKADGLASGKGVFICQDFTESCQVLELLFTKMATTVVIEQYLEGEEFTLMAFVDKTRIYPMVLAQDHKQAYDDDQGPNTGGMGAYAPLPQFNETITKQVVETVMQPVVSHLANNGMPFTGILYAGMMQTKEGLYVIEFNTRFGDPEAQVVLPLLESSLVQIIRSLLHHEVPEVHFSNQTSVAVVVAREEYPEQPTPKRPFPTIVLPTSQVFYSNLSKEKGTLYTDGGRIFVAQQLGESLASVRASLYQELEKNNWTNLRYRRDIGDRFAKRRTIVE